MQIKDSKRKEIYRRVAADSMNRERNLPSLISSDYYWQRGRREVVKLIRRNRARFERDELFVELGCGRGRDIWSIRDAFGDSNLSFVCTDADKQKLELARARKDYHEVDDVTFDQCNISERLPWKSSSVDIVYSSEVFEHIPDVENLIEEITRILKPGGHLLLTTPNQPNIFQRSYYSSAHRQRMREQNSDPQDFADDGTPLYGHVTLKTNTEWDSLLSSYRFDLVDHGRGAIWYGGTDFHENKFVLAFEFFLEGILDALPASWTRNISDQVIALYEKR